MPSLSKRDEYTFVPGISSHQHSVLTKAYSDAIFLALNALHPPPSISPDEGATAFNRYFPPHTQSIVNRVFNTIVGGNINSGNAAFQHLLIDVNDHNNLCGTTGLSNFINRNGTIITICPEFWTYIGDLPERSCADLPDDIVSWQMVFPGDSILNMLLGYVGETSLANIQLINYGLKNIEAGYTYTGAANAIAIKTFSPDHAVHSITNYAWYALVSDFVRKFQIHIAVVNFKQELYWSSKCGRSFRAPVNARENASGRCFGAECPPDY